MGEVVGLVRDGLACYRLTRLVTTDRITEPLRDRIDPGSTAGYFVRCDWCSGMWVAAGVVAARTLAPRVWAPIATALAFSAVTGIIAENT